MEDDFVVTLELLGVFGTDEVGLTLPASRYSGGVSFRRYASQDSWEPLKGAVIGFSFQSTLYTDNPRKLPKARQLRKRQRREKEITGRVFYVRQNGVTVRSLENIP